MLALKKKKQEAAAAAAAASAEAEASQQQVHQPQSSPRVEKVSLLGIGGRKTTKKEEHNNTTAKKRTPGEIRIQKGTSLRRICLTVYYTTVEQ